ncbi:MAG: UMP kinase [Haloarculaceae archaeon]
MKVVVSIGGSVLVPDDGADRVDGYAGVLRALETEGLTLAAVVGGGPTAREYIVAARDHGANEIELDQVGIAVTRLNARLLIAALGDRAAPTPPTGLERAREALRRGDLPVMGGTEPAHTTDAVAASLAEYTNADRLVLATSVPGVHNADPNVHDDASKLDECTTTDLIDLVANIEMTAGSNAPVDLLAAKIIQRAGLRTAVVDGRDPVAVRRAIEGDHEGTDVLPAGE